MSKYSSVGFGGGSSHYFGDMAQYHKFFNTLATLPRWSGTLQYTRYINPQMMLRTNFSWIRIVGDDYNYSTRPNGSVIPGFERHFYRNAHFRNDIKEFTVTGLLNLLPQHNRSAEMRNRFMPYLGLSLGFYAHDPQAKVRFREAITNTNENSRWVSLSAEGTGGQGQGINSSTALPYENKYNLIQPVMPLSLGFRMKLADHIDLTFEAAYRVTPFDYLDDIGSDYAFPADLASSGTGFPISIPSGMIAGVTTANLSQILADRSLEVIAARTGKDRTKSYELAQGKTVSKDATLQFFDPTTRQIGYDPVTGRKLTTTIGGSRFTKPWDAYATVQVAIHFILNTGVKCPVIK